MDILDVARRNQQKAWEIIEKVNVIPIWESIGAQVNLVGSLRMGLLMKHRDIDFQDRKSTRLNSSHIQKSRMPSSA